PADAELAPIGIVAPGVEVLPTHAQIHVAARHRPPRWAEEPASEILGLRVTFEYELARRLESTGHTDLAVAGRGDIDALHRLRPFGSLTHLPFPPVRFLVALRSDALLTFPLAGLSPLGLEVARPACAPVRGSVFGRSAPVLRNSPSRASSRW